MKLIVMCLIWLGVCLGAIAADSPWKLIQLNTDTGELNYPAITNSGVVAAAPHGGTFIAYNSATGFGVVPAAWGLSIATPPIVSVAASNYGCRARAWMTSTTNFTVAVEDSTGGRTGIVCALVWPKDFGTWTYLPWTDTNQYSMLLRGLTNQGVGHLVESSGRGLDVTNAQMVSSYEGTNQLGQLNPVIYFDDLTDVWQVTNATTSATEITLALWVKLNDVPGVYTVLMINDDAGTWDSGPTLYLNTDGGGTLHYGPQIYNVGLSASLFPAGEWVYIAAAAKRIGDLSTAYCELSTNGYLVASNTVASGLSYINTMPFKGGKVTGGGPQQIMRQDYVTIAPTFWNIATVRDVMNHTHPTNCLATAAPGAAEGQ